MIRIVKFCVSLIYWLHFISSCHKTESDPGAIFYRRVCHCVKTGTNVLVIQNQFKIATLTYETLATCQPSYFYNLLQVHQPSRALRSSTQKLLQVPFLFTDFGRRAFSYSSPATWNSVPTSIKSCSFVPPYTVSSATSSLTS